MLERRTSSMAPAAARALAPQAVSLRSRRIVEVGPDEVRTAGAPGECLTAELGACVAVCLYDPLRRRGGLAVLRLTGEGGGLGAPAQLDQERGGRLLRRLIEELNRETGRVAGIEAHLFGGAAMPVGGVDPHLGARGSSFALRFLDQVGVPVMGSDLGGCFPREVVFEPAAGGLAMEFLSLTRAESLAARERAGALQPAG